MKHEPPSQLEKIGIIAGTLAAVGLLVLASVLLLQPEGTSAKVLVAVWLWALPVLGVGAGIGWMAARILRRLTHAAA